jgi:hypothetical protein
VRAARSIDHAIGRILGRMRVLVDVRTPMNVAVLRPVWTALAADTRIALAFAAEQPEAVRKTLTADGWAGALIPRSAAVWQRWDLVLTADAWNHTPVQRCRRRMQFFHGVAGKYDLDTPQRLGEAGLHRFDRVAFINEDRLQRYVTAGVISPEQAVLVGYPKSDDLVNGRWSRAAVHQSLGLDESRPTIIYAPTFSVASSLHRAGSEIVRALLDTDLNVIVKLHDRSLVPDAHHTAGIDWPERFSRFAGNRRFVLARGADVEPLLAAADLLVTDHSTVGFEFALLDRPIVVFDAPDLLRAARIDQGKWDLLRAMSAVVNTPAQTVVAVRDALMHPTRLGAQRARARSLFASPGHATGRALSVVYELLGIHVPAVAAQCADTPTLSPLTGIGR